MTEPPTPDKLAHLRWLVQNRNDAQRILLDLFAHSSSTHLRAEHEQVVALLAGAAFSMWRAVFLGGTERKGDHYRDQMNKFLRKIIETNAINFNDEDKNKNWTVGYYLAGAKYRLVHAYDLLDKMGTAPEAIKNDVDFLRKLGGTTPEDTEKEWETARNVFDAILGTITKQT